MKKVMVRNFVFVLFFIVFVSIVNADVKLPSIISDNMVIQADKEVKIWGWADPKENITITIDKQNVSTKADEKGKWIVKLKPFKSGGPYGMEVKGKNTITVKNILIGEVWLASGQSNMQMSVISSMNPYEEIKNANYPNIRLFSVRNLYSIQPMDDVEGKWIECSSKTVGGFSAAAYFFGRELHNKLNVPIGLINSSWGGTPAEAWTSLNAIKSEKELEPIYNRYVKWADFVTQNKGEEYTKKLEEFKKQTVPERLKDPGNTGFEKGWANTDFDDSKWKEMTVGQTWEENGLNIDGIVWFRKEIDISESWIGKDLVVFLDTIDDYDTTYFNGVKIGETDNKTELWWTFPRKYNVPSSIVKKGKNIISVRVVDDFLSGGMVGIPEEMKVVCDKGFIPISGKWKYNIEYSIEQKPIVSSMSTEQNSPTVLFNAMINPLTNFAIKGAIWYQGESNAGRAYQYRTLFPVMIEDWRKQWNDKFQFLFVQLANFMQRKSTPLASSWAELREAQLMTLSLPNTGMAVIIDIGEEKDIHPKNKQDVGLRLALPALAKVYGKDVVYSGPIYKSMKVESNKIRLSFDHIGGGLVVKGEELKGFAIAGEDKKFYWAKAIIDGDTIVVSSENVEKPVAVRYAWADNPECNLYNKANLPASPFRTDNWFGITYNNK